MYSQQSTITIMKDKNIINQGKAISHKIRHHLQCAQLIPQANTSSNATSRKNEVTYKHLLWFLNYKSTSNFVQFIEHISRIININIYIYIYIWSGSNLVTNLDHKYLGVVQIYSLYN